MVEKWAANGWMRDASETYMLLPGREDVESSGFCEEIGICGRLKARKDQRGDGQ